MRIFENTSFNFVEGRKKAYIVSGTLLVLSLVAFIVRGLEMGIDFRGGMEFVVESNQALPATDVREALAGVLGQAPEVKTYADVGVAGNEALLIRTLPGEEMAVVQAQLDSLRAATPGEEPSVISIVQNLIVGGLTSVYPDASPTVAKTDIVGPRFAEDLKEGSIFAVLGSLLVIFIYVMIRFEWRFGLGAVAALFHDVMITLGVFSLLQGVLPFSLQIDQAIIAAFLTIVGYSLNDTVVIFDRIREFTNLFKTEAYNSVVNRSVNTTLSRTVVTSSTTLLVVITLFIFGGEVLRGFAFALIFGIIIGTYSSVFVATPVVVELHQRIASKNPRGRGR